MRHGFSSEADRTQLQLELLVLISDIPELHVDHRQPGRLVNIHKQLSGRPPALGGVGTAVVFSAVAEFAAVPQLKIVPRHQRGGAPLIVAAAAVRVDHRVQAVICNRLPSPGAEHLQECDLVAVRLVGELESALIPGDV